MARKIRQHVAEEDAHSRGADQLGDDDVILLTQRQHFGAHGAGKVLFGSNWPMIAPRKALEGLDELALPETARAAFLGGNAARVFGL